MNIDLRLGQPGDAEPCGVICYDAFGAIADQHNFPHDFPSREFAVGLVSYLLSHRDVYAVVAETEGRVIGSNFLHEGGAIAGVGPITVDPRVQNTAVGRQLMQDVIRRSQARQSAGVRLVQAAYHNRSLALYTKLGFATREPLSVMQGPRIVNAVSDLDVRPASAGDLESCNQLCLEVHGHHRGGEVADAIAQGTATVVERDGRLTGYATMIGFMGHAVSEDNNGMKALIAATPEYAGPGFLLPTRNADLLRWALDNGLRIVQPLTLMTMGLYSEPAGAFLPSILF